MKYRSIASHLTSKRINISLDRILSLPAFLLQSLKPILILYEKKINMKCWSLFFVLLFGCTCTICTFRSNICFFFGRRTRKNAEIILSSLLYIRFAAEIFVTFMVISHYLNLPRKKRRSSLYLPWKQNEFFFLSECYSFKQRVLYGSYFEQKINAVTENNLRAVNFKRKS